MPKLKLVPTGRGRLANSPTYATHLVTLGDTVVAHVTKTHHGYDVWAGPQPATPYSRRRRLDRGDDIRQRLWDVGDLKRFVRERLRAVDGKAVVTDG